MQEQATNTPVQTTKAQEVAVNLPPPELLTYDLETSLRGMAVQVFENYLFKCKVDQKKVDQIKEENKEIMKRFQELDFIMHKTLQRSGNISDLQQDVLDIKQFVTLIEARVDTKISEMMGTVELNQQRMKLVEHQFGSQEREVREFKAFCNDFMDKYHKVKESVFREVGHVKADVWQKVDEVKKGAEEMQSRINQANNDITIHLEELKRHDVILEVFKRNIKELYDSDLDLLEKKVDLDWFSQQQDLVWKQVRYLKQDQHDTALTLQQTDNYLDKYIPFRIQNYITETLLNILPKRKLPRLNDYIQHKYRILKELVAEDMGKPSLNKAEMNIPVIKKIELLLTKEKKSRMLEHLLDQSRQYIEKDLPASTESFVLLESDRDNESSQSRSKATKQPPLHRTNQEPHFLQGLQLFQGLETVEGGTQPLEKSQSGTSESLNQGFKKLVAKRNYLVYYPDMTQKQHEEVVNIRVDPTTNLVPVTEANENTVSKEGEPVPYQSQLTGESGQQFHLQNTLHSLPTHKNIQKMVSDVSPQVSSAVTQKLPPRAQKESDDNLLKDRVRQKQPLFLEEAKRLSVQTQKQQLYAPINQPLTPTRVPSKFQSQLVQKRFGRQNTNINDHNQSQSIKVLINTDEKRRGNNNGQQESSRPLIMLDKLKNAAEKAVIKEEEEDEEKKCEENNPSQEKRLTVSSYSSSSDRKNIRLQDLDDDLGEMVVESHEIAKQLKSSAESALLKLESAESAIREALERLTAEYQGQFRKEVEEFRLFNGNVQRDWEEDLKRRIREKSDADKKLEVHAEKVESMIEKVRQSQEERNRMEKQLHRHHQALDLLIKLGVKDEADRYFTSLYGYKGEAKEGKSQFKVHSQCQSCSGQQALTMHAFKLACMSYQPQPVWHQEKLASRDELFAKARDLLERVEGKEERELGEGMGRSREEEKDKGLVPPKTYSTTRAGESNSQYHLSERMPQLEKRVQTSSRDGSRNPTLFSNYSSKRSVVKREVPLIDKGAHIGQYSRNANLSRPFTTLEGGLAKRGLNQSQSQCSFNLTANVASNEPLKSERLQQDREGFINSIIKEKISNQRIKVYPNIGRKSVKQPHKISVVVPVATEGNQITEFQLYDGIH